MPGTDGPGRLQRPQTIGAIDGVDVLAGEAIGRCFRLPPSDIGQLALVPAVPDLAHVAGGLAVAHQDQAHIVRVAEGVGFEPTRPSSGLPAFEAGALNRTM